MSLETILKPIEAIDDYFRSSAQFAAETFHFDDEKRLNYVNKGLLLFNLSAGLLLDIRAGIPLIGVNLLYTYLNGYEADTKLETATSPSHLEIANRMIRLSTVGLTTALSYRSFAYLLDESNPQNQTVLEAISHPIGLITLGFGLLAARMYFTNLDHIYTKPEKPTAKVDPDGWIYFD